jgi:hypothetical protein
VLEPRPVEQNGPAKPGGDWLQTATQVAGLFAGLVAIVYVAGAVVLGLRLAFQDLPWGNVLSQLPRELLLSVGAGQVLLPALLLGALYGLYRLLRERRPRLPSAPRWRDKGKDSRKAARGYVGMLALMFLPLLVTMAVRVATHGDHVRGRPILVGFAVLLPAAVAVRESRSVLIRRQKKRLKEQPDAEALATSWWNSLRAAATMAGIYAVATIPVAMVAAGSVPFSEAKVCTADRHELEGVLVGETSDRVYLGERGDKPRRLVVLPLPKVEEMFIGEDVDDSECEISGATS